MEDKKKADNVFKGCVLLMLGLILWVAASSLSTIFDFLNLAFRDALGPQPMLWIFLIIGFAVMILGPTYYWVAVPIKNWLSKKT